MLVCVYRARNVGSLSEMMSSLHGLKVTYRFWALDQVAAGLEAMTAGVGPGNKFSLLNKLLDGAEPDMWLVVADDDVAFTRGSIPLMIRLMEMGGLDLAMPAHAQGSLHNHHLTLARPRTRLRTTTFVEIGPLFIMSPAGQSVHLPFPAEIQMGWGLEAYWLKAANAASQLIGVVDDVRVRHLGAIGAEYDVQIQRSSERKIYQELGLPQAPIAVTLKRWSAWRRRPPWT